jgi:hypothetical protein
MSQHERRPVQEQYPEQSENPDGNQGIKHSLRLRRLLEGALATLKGLRSQVGQEISYEVYSPEIQRKVRVNGLVIGELQEDLPKEWQNYINRIISQYQRKSRKLLLEIVKERATASLRLMDDTLVVDIPSLYKNSDGNIDLIKQAYPINLSGFDVLQRISFDEQTGEMTIKMTNAVDVYSMTPDQFTQYIQEFVFTKSQQAINADPVQIRSYLNQERNRSEVLDRYLDFAQMRQDILDFDRQIIAWYIQLAGIIQPSGKSLLIQTYEEKLNQNINEYKSPSTTNHRKLQLIKEYDYYYRVLNTLRSPQTEKSYQHITQVCAFLNGDMRYSDQYAKYMSTWNNFIQHILGDHLVVSPETDEVTTLTDYFLGIGLDKILDTFDRLQDLRTQRGMTRLEKVNQEVIIERIRTSRQRYETRKKRLEEFGVVALNAGKTAGYITFGVAGGILALGASAFVSMYKIPYKRLTPRALPATTGSQIVSSTATHISSTNHPSEED